MRSATTIAAARGSTPAGPPRRRHRPRGTPARRPATRRALAAVTGAIRWEVLPMAGVIGQAAHLPPGSPVTVTCSPARGIEPTVDTAVELARRGFDAVPHLAARQIPGTGELADLVQRLAAAGVTDVFVVGGDAAEPAGPFSDGLALLEAMAAVGHPFTRVGIPAYPEGHHRIDTQRLWQALAAKQPHASYVVTQMCFDSAVIGEWVAAARRRGIALPVYAGVPGAVELPALLSVSRRIGIGDSLRFARGNRRAVGGLLRPGGYRPEPLLRGLGARVREGCELAGVHVYTFNRVEPTVRRVQALRRRELDQAVQESEPA